MKLNKENKINYIVFCALAVWIVVFHILSFDRFGYYVDEIGSMYDAYCIANFGVDRWLQSYPIHFLNYGDGQSSIFVYILAVLFKVFGYEKWVVRLVPTVFHILTVFFIGKWIGLYDKKVEKYGYIVAAILPIFYTLFHFGLESHFMITFCAGFLFFMCRAVFTKKKSNYFMAGIFAGLSFYSYVLSYIAVPLFIILFITYLWVKKKICVKQVLAFIIPVVLMGTPLLIVQLINVFDLRPLVIGGITFPKFLVYRSNELGISSFFTNVYETFVNTNFYEKTTHLCIPGFGNLYYISIPFLVIGFISHCKKFKDNEFSGACVLWMVSMYLLAGLLQEEGALNNTRLNAIYIGKIACLIEGIRISSNALKKGWKWANIGLISVYGVCFILFISFYFTRYDLNTQSNLFMETYEDLPETEEVVYLPDNYCYFLWSKKINPYDFDIGKNGYATYGNYRFGYQKLSTEGCYLISKEDYVSQDTLNKFGFTKKQELEHFYLYGFLN